MAQPHKLRISSVITLFCLLFVFAVGVTNLKVDPIENDEFRTLNHIEPVWLTEARTIPETIQSVAILSPQHGPFYFVIMNAWHKLVGSDLFSLRLLSTFFGILSIATVYRLSMITGERQNAAAAALALSFLAFYVFHFHYLRMYTLLTLACGWLLHSYWSASLAGSQSKQSLISLFAVTALMPYIHYFGSLVLLAIGAYHILFVRRDRRWWRVLAVMGLAGLLFLPWLPYVISGLAEHQLDPTAIRLSAFEAIRATLSVISNGILVLPLVIAGLAIVNLRRLNYAEKYLGFVAIMTLALLVLLNQIAPVFVENRMRYVLVLTVPYCCIAVAALRHLPAWRQLRLPIAIVWIVSFFYYLGSDDYLTFTNIVQHETDKIPHYQDFVYEASELPGHNELILSFHPNMVLSSNKTLPYYRKVIPQWAYIVHITYDSQGDLIIQSGHARYGSLEAIAANSTGIWVLHNPGQSDLMSMPVFRNWFLQRFKICKRFLERDVSIIDYYVKLSIPCELITDDPARGIVYDNETELANYVLEEADGELAAYLWWRHTEDKRYSFSLQIFDEKAKLVGQHDQKISGEPIDIVSIDTSSLPAGDYNVQFIVYEFETLKSQSGRMLLSGESFDRVVEIYRFTIDA